MEEIYCKFDSCNNAGIAAAIGGFLVEKIYWQSILYFLIIYSIAVAIICSYLPETSNNQDLLSLQLNNIISNYKKQFKNYKLVLGAFIMGGNTAIVYIFSAVSPFIVIKTMQTSPELYGKLMIIPSLGLLLGSLLSVKLDFQISYNIILGLLIMLSGTILMIIVFYILVPSTIALFASMFWIFFGIAICYSNISAFTLKFNIDSSNGSAVISFINSAITMLSVILVTYFELANIQTLSLVFIFIITIMLLIFFFLLYSKPRTTSQYHQI